MIRPQDTAETDTLMPGRVLGDVRIGQLLGAGASSEVYQADSPVAGKPCAVKVLRSELGVKPVLRGRYEHVTHQVDHLGHSGVANTYAFGTTPGGRTYSVIELAQGQPLGQLVNQSGPLSRNTAVAIVRQICSALAVTHAHGIPHLRLHRGNVMVDLGASGAPRVVLLDFGVCQLHPPLPEPPSALALGPEHAIWVAPEQARGEPGDSRSDVYALALLLYEMLCGRVPFLGSSYSETLELQINGSVPPPTKLASIPPELEATLFRGLEKDPKRRIPSVEALLSAIDPLSATAGQHQVRAKAQQSRQRTLSTGEYRLQKSREQPPPAEVEPAVLSPELPKDRRRLLLVVGLSLAVALFTAVLLWSLLS